MYLFVCVQEFIYVYVFVCVNHISIFLWEQNVPIIDRNMWQFKPYEDKKFKVG